ncbi:hypothetical protein [Sphingosinicella sp. BN140058]|uniref:hypothetical protein n=1 Tax=Sphingosinicella sp. BN140058 TaxID=1892855 RepID=UPI0010123FD9|nr:hypothetical protein [Sphingosinicella sp. BN140058]QAY80385.1 hypothetical protein ETR14_27480 [Sphingosinicella sp. BN140058]
MSGNSPPLRTIDLADELELEFLKEAILDRYVDCQVHLRTGYRYHPNGNMRALLTTKAMSEIEPSESLYFKLTSERLVKAAEQRIGEAIAFLERRFGAA